MTTYKQLLLILAVSLLLPFSRLLSMDKQDTDFTLVFISSEMQVYEKNEPWPITLNHVLENREAYTAVKSHIAGLRAFEITEDEEDQRKIMTHYFDSHERLVQTNTSVYIKRKNVKPDDHSPSQNSRDKNRSSYWRISPKIVLGSLLIGLVYFAMKKASGAEKKIA